MASGVRTQTRFLTQSTRYNSVAFGRRFRLLRAPHQFEQRTRGSENRRHAERESRVDGEELLGSAQCSCCSN